MVSAQDDSNGMANRNAELEEEIKIKWTGDARFQIRDSLIAKDNNEDPEDIGGTAKKCFDRQKTQVVVKTEDELKDLLDEIEHYINDFGIFWMDGQKNKCIKRVKRTLEERAEEVSNCDN